MLAAAPPPKRPISLEDLPVAVHGALPGGDFAALRQSLERQTAERLREGEREHLIYYLLQSRRFTPLDRIEPAVSSQEFVESGRIPEAARRRLEAFERAPAGTDPRLKYLRALKADLETEYARVMRSLYQKEFGGAAAGWYQQRGHSSDTQVEAGYAVATALGVIRALDPPARLDHVLIVGPGVDFAPRTDFFEDLPPQSYQPFAVADALLSRRLASRSRLRIHAVDINERVVQFFDHRVRELRMVSKPRDPGYTAWWEQLGRHIGPVSTSGESKRVAVRREVAASVTAAKLNILTERYDPPPGYDLAVATNVLLYFNRTELLLALSNIAAMLRPGGYLVHNELRPEAEGFARAVGLQPLQARSLRLGPELLDGFVIHRK